MTQPSSRVIAVAPMITCLLLLLATTMSCSCPPDGFRWHPHTREPIVVEVERAQPYAGLVEFESYMKPPGGRKVYLSVTVNNVSKKTVKIRTTCGFIDHFSTYPTVPVLNKPQFYHRCLKDFSKGYYAVYPGYRREQLVALYIPPDYRLSRIQVVFDGHYYSEPVSVDP